VRQLANAIEAAVIRAAGEGVGRVEKIHLFPELGLPAGREREVFTFQEATRRFQAGFLREVLEEAGWSVTVAAQRMDLARSHVYKLIRVFNLTRERR